MRCSEIAHLRVGDVNLTTPELRWTGKGNKPREAVPGPTLVYALTKYLDLYRDALAVQRLDPTLPLVCQRPNHKGRDTLLWSRPCPSKDTITKMVVRVAD